MSPAPWRAVTVAGPHARLRVGDLRAWCDALGDRGVLVVVPDGHGEVREPPELGADDGRVAVRPAVDALVAVDDAGLVVETVDRARFAAVSVPQALRARSVRAAIEGRDDDEEVDPGVVVLRSGGALGELREGL